jgi:sugar phosphate isomerase/epimerase
VTRILTSTTSHKREPLLPSLEVFARLGLRGIDLNLHHVIEGGVPVDAIAEALAANDQRTPVVSGGWCDFFLASKDVEATDASVDRQVAIARRLGAGVLRLFFGRLPRDAYDDEHRRIIAAHLRRLSDRHPATLFVFENHDGASRAPEICREILAAADRANFRMNVDPINFERAGVRAADALAALRPFVAHVHLKGLDRGHFCEFGAGDVDLTPVLQTLAESGYEGRFTVEYEGELDGTVMLYQSVQRARAAIDRLWPPG